MSNKGLKSYTTNLEFSVGEVIANINLHQADANLILEIPIFNTVGFSPINLGLIYNKQNDSETGYFGKGVRLNYFTKLIDNNTSITMQNSDGSTDVYLENVSEYTNSETSLKISRYNSVNDEEGSTTYYLDVEDNYDNLIEYNKDNLSFPESIYMKNGEMINFSETSNYFLIENNNSDKVYLNKTNGLVTSIEWKKNSNVLLSAILGYNNSYLTSVKVMKDNEELKYYTIGHYSNEMFVCDNKSGKNIAFTFSGNMVTEVEEYMSSANESICTNISYSTHRTVVTDELSHINTYVFDNEGFLRFVKDENDNINTYNFDESSKQLLSESFISDNLEKVNLLENKTLANFTNNGLTRTTQTQSDPFYTNLIGSTEYKISGAGTLTYSVVGDFLAGDVFTFIVWVKNGCLNSGYIKIEDNNQYTSTVNMNKVGIDNEYHPMVVGLKLLKSSDKIKLTIGNTLKNFVVGKVELLRQKFGGFYEYDDSQNISSMNDSGNVSKYSYQGSLVTNRLSGHTKGVINKYDNRNRIIESLCPYQVKQTKTYDTKNRELTSNVKDLSQDEILNTVNSYPSDLETNNTNELSKTTNTITDEYGNIKKVTNALGHIVEYIRNGRMQIETIKLYLNTNSLELLKTYITYDETHHNKIKTIKLKNDSQYLFEYDEYDRIETISLNGIVLVTYTYDKFDNILTIRYGENGDLITFTYEKGNIKTIVFDGITYTYTYNKLNQIATIKKGTMVIKTLSYDTNGRIKRVLDEDSNELEYNYDNLDNINKRKRDVDGLTIYESFDRLYRSLGTCDTNMKMILDDQNDFYSGLMLESNKAINCGYSYINANLSNTSTPNTVEGVPCVSVSSSNKLSYNISGSTDKTTFGFFLRPSYIGSGDILLRLESGNKNISICTDSSRYIYLSVNNGSSSSTKVITTNRRFEYSRWTFISVTYQVQNGQTIFSMIIDGEIFDGTFASAITLSNKVAYAGYTVAGYVTGIIIQNNEALDNNITFRFYRLMLDYVINKRSILTALDFSNTTLYFDTPGFNLYPLHQDIKEKTGDETFGPVEFNIRETVETDTDRNFNFNTDIGRYAYLADGTTLNYYLNEGGNVSVGMRIYLDTIYTEKQYLFEVYSSNSTHVGLFVDSSGYINVDFNGTSYSTGYNISPKYWSFIGFSMSESINSDSVDEVTYSIKVAVNTSTYEKVLTAEKEFTGSHLSIGRIYLDNVKQTKFGTVKNVCPLMGQIEMLAIKASSSSLATLQTLRQRLTPITKVTGYDEFSRYKGTYINRNGEYIYKKRLYFKTRDNSSSYSSMIPSSEVFTLTSLNHTRSYESDDLGRIKGITDSVFGDHTFDFDERGFLKLADGLTILCDDNGNITDIGEKKFVYDSTIKDRLISFNGKSISYNDTNPLNPTSYDGNTFTWVGRRLKQIRGKVNLDFAYNDQGLRTNKTTDNDDIYYYYDKDMLITEIRENDRFDYLYDENKQLYGFIYNCGDMYFYIRDILQNIIGIIDINGNLVVKYDYTAFGICTILSDSTIDHIGTVNPFRYKGYYYDVEIGWYYCKSRYYVPEWGRWLNADNVNYLQPDSLTGMNLFMYCGNDPVNKYDPTGHIAWWVIALIVVGVVTIATSIGEVVAYNNAEEIYEQYKDTIQIEDGVIYGSSEVSNPFHIWALSAYVRYYTDSGAKGTSYGLALEWMYHNVGNSFGMSGGAEVNFGKTIFSDFENHSSISNFYFPIVMGVTELVTNPFFFIYDLVRTF